MNKEKYIVGLKMIKRLIEQKTYRVVIDWSDGTIEYLDVNTIDELIDLVNKPTKENPK